MWKVAIAFFVLLGSVGFLLKDYILDKCSSVSGPYAFLRSHDVNGRLGPGKEYPCVRVYKRRFLPMRILGEQDEWFFLEDWSGERVWVHRSLCSKRARYVLVMAPEAFIKASPKDNAYSVATVSQMVCLELLRLGDEWLRVRVRTHGEQRVGWIQRGRVWGV